MGLILILAQIVLVVLSYAAHVVHLSPWIVFLPGILFAVIWVLASLGNATFAIDRINPFISKRKVRR